MASLIVAGDTSGTVTLQAPAIAGSTVLTLPTTSGTIVTTAGGSTVPFALGSASSPSITFTGDTNTGIFSPGADTIAFSEGGVESMRIDSSGNVGIGTTSPFEKLDVRSTNATFSTNGENTNVFITSGYDVNLRYLARLRTDFNGLFSIATGSGSSLVAPSANSPTNRLSITNSGTVVLQGGNTSATGVGITFPASQSASSDANTLDDYEEGTWTPGITFGGGSTGVVYTVSNTGFYTKVGRLVTLTFAIDVSNKGSSTGNAFITGAPFSCINSQGGRGGAAIGYTGGLSVNNPNIMMDAGSGAMAFRTPNGADMNNTSFFTSFSVYCSYSYFV
jgi:hypothetical protein